MKSGRRWVQRAIFIAEARFSAHGRIDIYSERTTDPRRGADFSKLNVTQRDQSFAAEPRFRCRCRLLAYSRHIERLTTALVPHRPYLRNAPSGLPFAWDTKTIRNGLNFTLTTNLGDIDLLGEVASGKTYQTLLPHSFEVEAFGVRFKCIDLPTLIWIKEAAGRRKDQEAIAELRVLLEEIEKKQT
jgi:hypothetical protein